MAQESPSLNEIEPSWADIQIAITPYDGAELNMNEIAGINWSRSVEVGERRGTSGGRVMARTTGAVSYEASMTVYRSGYRKLLQALMANAPERGDQLRVGLVGFDIIIQHTPPNSDSVYTNKIKGCRLLGDSSDQSEGTDAQQLEITLNPLEIVELVDDREIALI